MKTNGTSNPDIDQTRSYKNLSAPVLIEHVILRGEGKLSDTGALVIESSDYTGRLPEDKYIVDTEKIHDYIQWGKVNRPLDQDTFRMVKAAALDYLYGKDTYVFDGFAGADPRHRRKFKVINELPAQNLFRRNMLIRPTGKELDSYGDPDFTILSVPGYKCNFEKLGLHSEAAIIIDYEAHFAVIVGTHYCGEIKKAVFSIMNLILPLEDNVLPMHCSANMDHDTGDTAIFFGLSGTGKTTLSAEPGRMLIGDDEHGWSDDGVFNIEGGCYAKCIDLSKEGEPEIFNAIKFGAIMENVVMDQAARTADYSDKSISENTRVAYPVDFISNAQLSGIGGIPKVVIFLTADAFGVLPPVSKLNLDSAMYHFVSGFTSKVAGTETGIVEPKQTFSSLFGEPFMPLAAEKYARMLGTKLEKYGTDVFLVNTGWSGGPYGVGSRIRLQYTRAIITAIINGELKNADYLHNDLFNLNIPKHCSGVPDNILNPRNTWSDKAVYDAQAMLVAKMFADNFSRNHTDISNEISDAGPYIYENGKERKY